MPTTRNDKVASMRGDATDGGKHRTGHSAVAARPRHSEAASPPITRAACTIPCCADSVGRARAEYCTHL